MRNRVAESGIITLDLKIFYPQAEGVTLAVAPFLEEGILVREKPFRQALASHPWERYMGKMVAIDIPTEALVPSWAYMLLGKALHPYAVYYGVGDIETVRMQYVLEQMARQDWQAYADKRVVLKGCGSVPPEVYLACTRYLLPHVKKLMFGEPCSMVPVYSRS
ncbi:MAG: DUF2480 family protein [Bacteroidia bacterium]